MSTLPSAPPVPAPEEKQGWALFSGEISDQSVARIFNLFHNATNNGFTHIHALFQSTGGIIGSGVALYNFFKELPISLTLYNVGSVASIGAIAFLGAKQRIVSQYGAFMIHRTYNTAAGLRSEAAQAIVQSLIIDDNRVEAILRTELALSDEQWNIHKSGDLWIDADTAVKTKFATAIGSFAPPLGAPLVNV